MDAAMDYNWAFWGELGVADREGVPRKAGEF